MNNYLESTLKGIAERAKRIGTVSLDDRSIEEFISFCLRDDYEIAEALEMEKCRDYIEREIISCALGHTDSDELSEEQRAKALAAFTEEEMDDLVCYLHHRLGKCDDPIAEILGYIIGEACDDAGVDLEERVTASFHTSCSGCVHAPDYDDETFYCPIADRTGHFNEDVGCGAFEEVKSDE